MTAPLTPRERVEAEIYKDGPADDAEYCVSAEFARQLAAELEEANRRIAEQHEKYTAGIAAFSEDVLALEERVKAAERDRDQYYNNWLSLQRALGEECLLHAEARIADLKCAERQLAEQVERRICAEAIAERVERLRPEHKCEIVARAPFMADGRDWWIGKLKEPVAEWPKETHCLHMKTPLKDVVFLCNRGDFEALATLACCYFGEPVNDDWVRSMITYALKAAQKETP